MQAYVPLRLDGNMRKCGKTSICTATSTGRNAQDRKFWTTHPGGETSTCMGRIGYRPRAKRPRSWGESSRWRIVQRANRPGVKRPGGETSRQGAKRLGGETSSYRWHSTNLLEQWARYNWNPPHRQDINPYKFTAMTEINIPKLGVHIPNIVVYKQYWHILLYLTRIPLQFVYI